MNLVRISESLVDLSVDFFYSLHIAINESH